MQEQVRDGKRDREPYEAPKLVVYGEVEKLTGMQQPAGFKIDEQPGIPVTGRPFAS